jgi:hypothetical protein
MNASSDIIASVARIRQHGVHGADSARATRDYPGLNAA